MFLIGSRLAIFDLLLAASGRRILFYRIGTPTVRGLQG